MRAICASEMRLQGVAQRASRALWAALVSCSVTLPPASVWWQHRAAGGESCAGVPSWPVREFRKFLYEIVCRGPRRKILRKPLPRPKKASKFQLNSTKHSTQKTKSTVTTCPRSATLALDQQPAEHSLRRVAMLARLSRALPCSAHALSLTRKPSTPVTHNDDSLAAKALWGRA